jgi:hypothetical protein
MDRILENLLDEIQKLVDDTDRPWTYKRDALRAKLTESDPWSIAFEEFISWFPEGQGTSE